MILITLLSIYLPNRLGVNKKWKNKYYSVEHGINSRLDEVQSSILNLKIKNINFFIKRRRTIAKKYLIPKNYKKFYTLKKGNIIINEVYKKKSSN